LAYVKKKCLHEDVDPSKGEDHASERRVWSGVKIAPPKKPKGKKSKRLWPSKCTHNTQ
jgi:hypothetical protein